MSAYNIIIYIYIYAEKTFQFYLHTQEKVNLFPKAERINLKITIAHTIDVALLFNYFGGKFNGNGSFYVPNLERLLF